MSQQQSKQSCNPLLSSWVCFSAWVVVRFFWFAGCAVCCCPLLLLLRSLGQATAPTKVQIEPRLYLAPQLPLYHRVRESVLSAFRGIVDTVRIGLWKKMKERGGKNSQDALTPATPFMHAVGRKGCIQRQDASAGLLSGAAPLLAPPDANGPADCARAGAQGY